MAARGENCFQRDQFLNMIHLAAIQRLAPKARSTKQGRGETQIHPHSSPHLRSAASSAQTTLEEGEGKQWFAGSGH